VLAAVDGENYANPHQGVKMTHRSATRRNRPKLPSGLCSLEFEAETAMLFA
jgi:hypothetical protein